MPYRPTNNRRVGCQITDYSLRRPLEQRGRTPPSIIATALETLAVKAFGDMGQRASLRLIRDRFITGHNSCELRRHLDSVPPETPICDVVDWCRIWESHADPAVRRVGKPSPDPIYPAHVVGDSDSTSEPTQVAAVTWPRSGPDQLEDLLRRLLMAVDFPAPILPPPTPRREVVTASGGRDTGSTVAGRESSGVGVIRADAAVVPLWTAADAAASSTTKNGD